VTSRPRVKNAELRTRAALFVLIDALAAADADIPDEHVGLIGWVQDLREEKDGSKKPIPAYVLPKGYES
jgi:hypothetical protein